MRYLGISNLQGCTGTAGKHSYLAGPPGKDDIVTLFRNASPHASIVIFHNCMPELVRARSERSRPGG